MKSETITVQQLFQDRRQYRVPFYQRAYVWNKEDQWERLWSDIESKAEVRLSNDKTAGHFLGAAVLEPQSRKGLLGVETFHIIDGQQRLTTLQYVLAALALELRARQSSALLSLVEGCLWNAGSETMEVPEIEVFKVWPTFRDRDAFKTAMRATTTSELRESFPQSFTQGNTLRKIGFDHPPSLEAIWYFSDRIAAWIGDEEQLGSRERVTAIVEAVLRDLKIVSIALGEDDDAQIIFETLNGHGAQLHATDLIRNFIFMRADREQVAAGELYEAMWSPFEATFWTEGQRRGRLVRPRLEWFMQTSLQTQLAEEVDVGRLYVGYRRFVLDGPAVVSASDQLGLLNRYAEHYRHLVSGVGDTPIAEFGRRVAVWDASTTHAIALLIAKSDCSIEQQRAMFDDLVSYFVRRAVCGLTSKNYNKVFLQQLKTLAASAITADTLKSSLAKLEGDASRWPSDDEFRKSWVEGGMYYGRLNAAQAKWMLTELEAGLRSKRTEEPFLLSVNDLDVDHILPTSWYEHWVLPDGTFATEAEAVATALAALSDQPLSERHNAINRREAAKKRIGNLTLLHYGVNRGLQHHDFGKKRAALFANSNLQLNRELMMMNSWTEDDIDQRSRALFEVAKKIWRGPKQL